MHDETLFGELETARGCASRRPCWELGDVKPDCTLTLTLWNSAIIEVSFLTEAQRWLIVRRYDEKQYDRYEFKPGELPSLIVEAMLDMEIKPLAGWQGRMLARCSKLRKH